MVAGRYEPWPPCLQIGKTPCDEAHRGLKAEPFREKVCLISSFINARSHESTFIAQSARKPIFWCDAACLIIALCHLVDAAHESLDIEHAPK
jgi:hypothetical protein